MSDAMNYRVALILPKSRKVCAVRTHGVFELPIVRIPLSERPALFITRLIRDAFDADALVLDAMKIEPQEAAFMIVEIRCSSEALCNKFTAIDVDALQKSALHLQEIHALIHTVEGTESQGPFSRIGWIDDLSSWVSMSMMPRGNVLTRELDQFNAGGGFCLLRFTAVDGRNYWLKATAGGNAKEFHITRFLSASAGEYLPASVGFNEKWNAWLLKEHGCSLSASPTLRELRRVARALAELQKLFVGKSDSLFSAHCGDHRSKTLRSRLPELFEYIGEAMSHQTSSLAKILSPARLCRLEHLLDRICSRQEEVGTPDTIVHSDIGPDNTLDDGNTIVFTDWCEGNVGNPFLSLELMCAHYSRPDSFSQGLVEVLRDEYSKAWITLLSKSEIDESFALARFASVLSQLHAFVGSLASANRYDPRQMSYTRSLARHIDRVATENQRWSWL